MNKDVDLSNMDKFDRKTIEGIIERELQSVLRKSKDLEQNTKTNFEYSMALLGAVILFGIVVVVGVFIFMFYKRRTLP